MRTFLYLAAALVTLLCGGWFVVASEIESRVEAAIADLRAQGWQVDYAQLSTTGFPLRFDTAATELSLASPDGDVVWEAPSFRFHASSHQPNRLVAVWPQEQSLTVAGQSLLISARDLRASATAGLSTDLPLNAATVESGLTAVEAESGWGVGMDRLTATAERSGAAYDLFLEAEGLRPATSNASIGLLRLDAQIILDAPVALRSGTMPHFSGVALRQLRVAQGDVALTGTGALAPDARGYLSGTVTVAVENWRGFLDLLSAAGLLTQEQRPFLDGALEEMAQGRERIEVPITFANGQVSALGLVLLDAPRVL